MSKVQRPGGDRPRKPAGASSDASKGASKAKGSKVDNDDEDPMADLRSAQREDIGTDAIPLSELKKAKYEKQIPGQFDFEAFASKGFGEGYSKEKRDEMEKMYS